MPFFAISFPAHLPVDHAAWKLNHQVTPSISSISPAKYTHGQILLSIVCGLISLVEIPHALTNSSHGLRAMSVIGNPFPKRVARRFFWSFERSESFMVAVFGIVRDSALFL